VLNSSKCSELEETLCFLKAKRLGDDATSRVFHRLFTSYSKAINKQQKRHGSLFENPFKRKEVGSTHYLANLVFYIHANPQHHGIDNDFRQYPWSSYQRIISGKPSKLKKEDILAWFNDAENYIVYHTQKADLERIKELIIE
jgi:putative transposase